VRKSVEHSSSGIREFSVGYLITPWKTPGDQRFTVLYRAYDDFHARLASDPNDAERCILTIEDESRRTTRTIALSSSGSLNVDGKVHRIEGADVSVTAERGTIVIAVDNKELISIKE
jgi:hypothetical protein